MLKIALDTSPLREYPLYRRVLAGHLVSFFGSQITYVALPWQLYQLTHSTFQVGLLSLAQLIPLLVVGFWGGAVADAFERRWVCVFAEVLLACCNLVLIALTLTHTITAHHIYAIGAVMAGLNSFHRPAYNSLIPQLVKPQDIPRISPINGFCTTFGMIAGPALGGILLSGVGVAWTYAVDFATYAFASWTLLGIPRIEVPGSERKVNLSAVTKGFRYAWGRKDLLGTYLVDMVSMAFAFPNPLFPMLAAQIAGNDKVGWYYSATAVGACLGTLTSGWTPSRRRHGMIITLAATGWGLGIAGFGLTVNHFIPSLLFLVAAGWSDIISGIFRGTVWNQTIPGEIRGRLASIEMLSYASGPLVGSSIMGFLADLKGPSWALTTGGLLAAGGCLILGRALPPFWHYRAPEAK
jgi:MFS family permease